MPFIERRGRIGDDWPSTESIPHATSMMRRSGTASGGVTFAAQLVGSLLGAAFGFAVGIIVYGTLKLTLGIRLTPDQ